MTPQEIGTEIILLAHKNYQEGFNKAKQTTAQEIIEMINNLDKSINTEEGSILINNRTKEDCATAGSATLFVLKSEISKRFLKEEVSQLNKEAPDN